MLRLFRIGNAERELLDIRDFTKDKCFLRLTLQDVQSQIYFSSNDNQHLGIYTPEQFAEKFHKEFLLEFNSQDPELLKKRMEDVKHLYITCESAAFKPTDKKFLAQAVADALYDKGFKKIQVHSYILNEPLPLNFELEFTLFINSNSGEISFRVCLSNSEINALITKCNQLNALIGKINRKIQGRQQSLAQNARNADLVQELTELRFIRAEVENLEGQKKQFHRQIEAKPQAKILVEKSQIELELNKPIHTFIPFEGEVLRQIRISTAANNPPNADQLTLSKLQHEVFKLFQSLSSEIESTSKQVLGWFFHSKITTKKVKQAALLELLQTKNLREFSDTLKRLDAIKEVVCGGNSRVRQLLSALNIELSANLLPRHAI